MAPPEDHAEAVIAPLSHWRIRIVAAIAFSIVALVATAHADPRGALDAQLSAEAASIDRALAAVTEKLVASDQVRSKRLAAAVRSLQAVDRTAVGTARRRAASRLLIERDRVERELLAGEARRLEAARMRTQSDASQIGAAVIPTELARPVRGQIARTYGSLVHERSKATLARRGLEFEVENRAHVISPGDGVVRFAGAIRGLDAGVIIDHGGYYTVLGKLGDVGVVVGANVARGDRIARAARRRVYFEVRVKVGPGGRPIDPEPLVK
jgi:septal ring factor EnvC (AmiA/AmiB activator)